MLGRQSIGRTQRYPEGSKECGQRARDGGRDQEKNQQLSGGRVGTGRPGEGAGAEERQEWGVEERGKRRGDVQEQDNRLKEG